MFSKFIPQEQRLLSSAKFHISHFAKKNNKLLMKILKNYGSSTEPCEIPFEILVQSLNVEPILIICVWFVR